MAGSAIKRRRREIAEQAVLKAAHESLMMSTAEVDRVILQAYADGEDPVLLMMPTARALVKAAKEGDVPAIREVFDRVSGRVGQDVEGGGVVVDGGFLLSMGELLGRLTAGGGARLERLAEIDVTPIGEASQASDERPAD